ncbi:hypothetical protein ANCDUO_04975 [Ancylostoma duodenale]|uniref:Uncharacterized protein n=1 Tax=Ancylostoma duodenale TaxID=51022 RepID=A0A0C2H5J8_9BILA|nr:hypothetical protein ANCDUO_04975 [Ancylostoma duodenale]
MQQSKFVVVEVTTTTSTMTLIQYLITNGFDKFAVVSDLSDHPSLKYKVTSHAGSSTQNQPQNNGVERQSAAAAASATSDRNGKPKVSINEIASALSRKSSPSQLKNGFCGDENSWKVQSTADNWDLRGKSAPKLWRGVLQPGSTVWQ